MLVLAGLGYWRYVASKPSVTTSIQQTEPIEVPSHAPQASLEERVKALEDLISKVVVSVNALKGASSAQTSADAKISALEASNTELKARVSILEKATPVPAATTTSKSTVYIPLGSGGGPWNNQDWYSTPEYQISLDPGNYPGYSAMYLEVTFRMTESAGTGSVRLYNTTDSSAISGQVDTTSSSFGTSTSSSFKLSSGTKSYSLQIKSSEGKDLYVQTARIKVNF